MRVVHPAGIRDAVALGCLTYSHTRWGDAGVQQPWLLAAMQRLEYNNAHVIAIRRPAYESNAIQIHKSIASATVPHRLFSRPSSPQSEPDVADPEIRVDVKKSALCEDCRFYKSVLGKSFFECLTTEACCQNVEVCRPCLAAGK